MRYPRTLTAATVATVVALGGGTALAVGAAPGVQPGQTLASYIGDGQDAQWDKVQTWIEAEYGEGANPTPTTAPAPEPSPTQEPAPSGPRVVSGAATHTATGMVWEGQIADVTGNVTLRASANPLTGQTGWYLPGTPDADGNVRIELTKFTNTDPRHWQLELGDGGTTYGEVLAAGEVSPTATTQPAGNTTGGAGGSQTDQLNVPFTSNGLSSKYHVFAAGLDWTKPVGLLMYGDGSGGYGIDNPNATYLLDADGTAGLVAVAKKHNLLLVTPEAPAPGCDGYDNCWYDSTAPAKAQWASDLMTKVKGQYDLDLDRIAIGGYSSGAQWTTRWFLPAHGEAQSVDLAVPIAYGGAPAVTPAFTAGYKAGTVVSFDTGKSDPAYSSQSWGAIGGYNWYTGAGFVTDSYWPDGVAHSRGGEFGGIIDREVTQWLPAGG